jgi:aminocarboxymuconate-semialdehyde decarboxylase
MSATAKKLLVDVHSHVYLPRYASLLRSRSSVPKICSVTTSDGIPQERLLILNHEPSGGRPVGSQYWDREGFLLSVSDVRDQGLTRYRRETQVHG